VTVDELREAWGDNPQLVGAEDGTEDDWGDLICDAACVVGLDPETMSDEDWDHFQLVALESRATTLTAWLAPLEALA
jgi:hypothetical protein